jgi:sulfide:quinone oxidoreductase
MSESSLRVVIAGGGVAGLEALTALHALAGERVELTLVAPEDEFVYRPLAVEEPFGVGQIRHVPLPDAARDAEAAFVAGTITGVNPEKKIVDTSERDPLEYDALVLAVGAEAVPAVTHAMTWDDRSDAETLGGLLRDVEEGYSQRVAVVIPPGPVWPLRGYELALLITLQAKEMSADVQTTLVTPEPSPLALLGPRAFELVLNELDRAGVAVVAASHVERGDSATIILRPSGRQLEVDRMLALPILQGRPIAGIPTNGEGFIDVDEHCRARGLDGVWAAGDGTAFPLKSGGFAAEQADVAAEDIAAAAGAAIEPRAFDPADREELAGLPSGSFLKAWLGGGDEHESTTGLPVVGVPVLTYLQRDLAAGWRGHF